MYKSFLQRSCETNVFKNDINTESKIKLNQNQLTSNKDKCTKLLQTRPYATTPYMGGGKTCSLFPKEESELKFSEITSVPKSVNSLSGVTINRFTPLLPCIKDNVQDTKHIIPTDWVRGGSDTRAVIRNIDYRKECSKF